MDKTNVLFVCVHNSARSQMAEAYLKQLAGDHFEVDSAGISAGVINPHAVTVMAEEGIDISKNLTKSVFDLYKKGRHYRYVIAVCDQETAEQCPIFPGLTERITWSFRDPSKITGTDDEKMAQVRIIRDQIKFQIQSFVQEKIKS